MLGFTASKFITLAALAASTLAQNVSFTAFAEQNCVLTSPDAGDTVVTLQSGQCVDFAMVHSLQGHVFGQPPDTINACRIHLFPDLRCANLEFANIGPLELGQTTDCITPESGDFFSVALVC